MSNYNYSFQKPCQEQGIIDPIKRVVDLYEKGLSCNEISEKFLNRYKIRVTPEYLARIVKKHGKIRTYSERKLNAIKRGRMVYYKMPKIAKYSTKSISAGVRFYVLNRDQSRCQICGRGIQDGVKLELHHIDGKESTPDNLKTLCFECHRGLHDNKKEGI